MEGLVSSLGPRGLGEGRQRGQQCLTPSICRAEVGLWGSWAGALGLRPERREGHPGCVHTGL